MTRLAPFAAGILLFTAVSIRSQEPSGAPAADDALRAALTATAERSVLPERCGECHAAEFEVWENEELVNRGGHSTGSDFELVAWSDRIRHNFLESYKTAVRGVAGRDDHPHVMHVIRSPYKTAVRGVAGRDGRRRALFRGDVLPDGRLRLDGDVALPELLDVLVVGGGPAGTAAAFRARELGFPGWSSRLRASSPASARRSTGSTLSRRHASVVVAGPGVFVRDLNSRNGIHLKLAGSCLLADGDVVRIGAQTLRFHFPEDERRFETRIIDASSISGRVGPPAGASDAAPTTVMTFGNRGASCPFRAGQTICEVAEANDVELAADCHAGICGSDPVRIVSGGAHLNPMSGEERATLEEICAVDPDTHRLACMTRPTGAVVIEIIDQ